VRLSSSSSSSSTAQHFERKWSTPLAKTLADAIATTGPISVAAYMRQCLTSPSGGYYTTPHTGHDPFGAAGDFITSPEISQIFGELIGLWVVAEWMAQGRRDRVQVIEIGPGRGTLMDDVLRTCRAFRPFAQAVDAVYLVERSAHLRDAQHKLLCGDAPLEECDIGHASVSKYGQRVLWSEEMSFVPSDPSTSPFILAHELFDALPIHIFQSVSTPPSPSKLTISTSPTPPPQPKPQTEWRELLVTPTPPPSPFAKPSGGSTPDFTLTLSPLPTPHSAYLPSTSPRYRALLPTPGSTIEISPESLALAFSIATRIGGSPSTPRDPAGAALILDYGPADTIPTNSLRGIRAHARVSPFETPGEVDLSADVDFGALAEAAINASEGVEVHGPVEQAYFLSAMGGKERAEQLVRGLGGTEAVQRIEGAWRRLVDRGPNGMGKIYKALAIVPYVGGKVRRPVGFGGDV
ncbi:DUF185-domain-containing protein, partial [Trichodelitschia bisporula]